MEKQITAKHNGGQAVVETTEPVAVKCHCCGLTEECTEPYICRVRERYQGCWICGLCSEAVKYETLRSQAQRDVIISTDEALKRHTKFCRKFKSRSTPPMNPTEDLIMAMKQLLLRTLMDSPSKEGTNFACHPPLRRSKSCFK